MYIKIKETKDLDYEQVVDIFFEIGWLKHQAKRRIYKKAIEKAFRNSQLVVSAWDGEKLVGFARVLTDKSIFATIWNMIVKPEFQKKGVGKKIVQKCLNKFPNLYFFLFSSEHSADFYKKMGFDKHRFGMYSIDGFKKCVIYN